MEKREKYEMIQYELVGAQFNYRECQPHCLMYPSQLIQGEDVIIYKRLGLGRLFCDMETRKAMRTANYKHTSKQGSSPQHMCHEIRHQVDEVENMPGYNHFEIIESEETFL